MGINTNLMIIFLVISLALTLVNPSQWGSPLADMLVSLNPDTGEINYQGIRTQILIVFSSSLIAGIIAGLWKADVTYGLFSGFAVFMLGFAIVPLNFFVSADIPFFIKAMVGLPMAVMFLLGLIGWFRGSEL